VGVESSRIDGRQANLHDLKAERDSDIVLVERCVEDSVNRFDGERGESASRFVEGRSAVVRSVEEKRMVVVTRDPVIVGMHVRRGWDCTRRRR